MAKIRCKYCQTRLDPDHNVMYTQSNTGESNCEHCEIVCRIAVDMISQGVTRISPEHAYMAKDAPESRWNRFKKSFLRSSNAS